MILRWFQLPLLLLVTFLLLHNHHHHHHHHYHHHHHRHHHHHHHQNSLQYNYYSPTEVVFHGLFRSHNQELESWVGNFLLENLLLMAVISIRVENFYVLFPQNLTQ